MKIRKLIAATGTVAAVTAMVVTSGAGTASAAPKDCAILSRASARAAMLMDIFMDVGDFAAWDRTYTNWLNIEAALEGNNC